jgi:hypothetical protein
MGPPLCQAALSSRYARQFLYAARSLLPLLIVLTCCLVIKVLTSRVQSGGRGNVILFHRVPKGRGGARQKKQRREEDGAVVLPGGLIKLQSSEAIGEGENALTV